VTGSSTSTLVISGVTAGEAGSYTVVVSGTSGSETSTAASLSVAGSARLIDVAARASVGTGSNILIAGFVVGGSGSKTVLLRGVGPTLGAIGVPGAMTNPQLSIFNAGASAAFDTNTVWGGSPTLQAIFTQVGAFSLASNSADSVLLETLNAGGYTAEVAGVNSGTGVALAEVYDADTNPSPSARFINLAARASVGSGANILIAGFVVGGSGTETVLLRGVGPTLGAIGVPGALAAPVLTLIDANQKVIATNSAWNSASVLGNSPVTAIVRTATAADMQGVGAFALSQGSLDTAMVVTLPIGSYTAQVSGANSTTGVGLAEIYEMP